MPTYRVHQFAELAVTVKALRHYDRLGLVKPMRSAAGYRLYRASDLARLQQIVALKSVGLPLKDIRTLLDRDPLPLIVKFRQQREVLEDWPPDEWRALYRDIIAAIAGWNEAIHRFAL